MMKDYPNMDQVIYQALATELIISGLRNGDHRSSVWIKHPATVEETLDAITIQPQGALLDETEMAETTIGQL